MGTHRYQADTEPLELDFTDTYARRHGIYIKSAKKGAVTLGVPIKPYMLNLSGNIHGGLLALLCDEAAGVASHTYSDASATLNMSINYIKGVPDAVELEACATVRHGGRSTRVIEVTVTDDQNRLICTATATYFVLKPSAD